MAIYDPNKKNEEVKEENGFLPAVAKGLSTVNDVIVRMQKGMASGVEGIGDFALNFSGLFGNQEYKDWVKKQVAKDNSENIDKVMFDNWVTNPVSQLYGFLADKAEQSGNKDLAMILRANSRSGANEQSYITGSGAEQYIDPVLQSLGGMLLDAAIGAGAGSVAGAIAGKTGSTAAGVANAAAKAKQVTGLATLGVRSAGNATGEAYKDGASYGRGTLYGIAQGATEVATEMMFDSPINKIYNSGFLRPVASTFGGKVVKGLAGEAIEEVASELANPLEKAIYKGKDALKEYGEGDYWKGVGLAGASGALTAGIVGTATGSYSHANMASEFINDAQTEIAKRSNQDAAGKLTAEKEAASNKKIQSYMQAAEKNLTKMSEAKRADFFAKNAGASAIFTEDGKIRPEFARKTWGGQSASETANGAQAQNAGLSDGQKRYVSVNARYDGERATNAVKALQDALDKQGKGETAEIYSGELSSEQEETYAVAKRIVNNLNQTTGDDMALIVVGGENDFNALNEKNGNAILISEKTLAKTHGAVDALAKILFEEATHSTQSTNAAGQYMSAGYAGLFYELATGNSATMEAITARLLADGNGYGFTQEMLESIESKLDSRENLTEDEKKMLDRINEKAKKSEKLTEEEKELLDRVTLTAKEQELLDEIGAQTVGEILGGNKEIVEKYASNKNAAEKILGVFGKIKKALSRATNKTARAERARVERVEGMLLNALAEKGLTYQNGKVISARPPEEKENTAEAVDDEAVRFSKTDSLGNVLTDAQQRYFENSKVRDENGRLLVMYHGTSRNFNTFLRSKMGKNGLNLGEGFYFTPNKSQAERYTEGKNPRIIEAYLNIRNPLSRENSLSKNKDAMDFLRSVLSEHSADYIDDMSEGLVGSIELIKEYVEKTGEGVDEILKRFGYDGIDAINTYVIFDSNQAKYITNEKPTARNDLRFSRAATPTEEDKLYLSAVQNGDTASAQKMVDEAAEKAFSKSKIRSSDGKLRKVYHGTNQKNFTIFDYNKIGTANDRGWYGRGFYFAYTSGEASYYGDRIIPAYINIIHPFDYEAELGKYTNQNTNTEGDLAAFVINLVEKFPNLANNLYIDAKSYSNENKKISFKDYANQILSIYNDDKLKIYQSTNRFGEEVYIYEYNGDLNNFALRHAQYITKDRAEKSRLNAATAYVNNKYLDIDTHIPEYYMKILSSEFSKELQKRGYDGVIQSDDGDEVVAFYQNQIKSADPVTYDDDGNVIPLSERFNEQNADIRFSRAPQTDTEQFKRWFGDSKIVNDDGTPKVMYHGTKGDFTVFDRSRSGENYGGYNAAGGGFDFTDSERRARLWGAKAKGTGPVRVIPVYLKAEKTFYSYNGAVDPALEAILPEDLTEKERTDAMSNGATFHKVVSESGIDFAKEIQKFGYDSYAMYPGDENIAVYSPTQIKSATDNIGTFDPSNPDIRFSRGLNARVAANNTGERVFSKKVAKAAIDTIMESNLVFGDEYSTLRGTIRGKGRIIDELFYKLNRTQNRDYQRAVANSIADQIIDSTVLTETYSAFAEQDAANIEQAKRIAEMMSGYRHGIKFKNIEGDVKYAKDDRWAGYKLQWAAKEGDPLAVSADQLVDAFDEIGVKIDAVNDADIFLEAMRLYENARETINNAVYKVKLSEYGSQEELARMKKTISDEIMSVFENGGERSKFSKMVSRYTDQIKFMREMWKVSKKVSEIKMEGKRFASDTRSPQLNAAISLLKGMTRGSNLIPGRAREVCRNLSAWYSPENNLFKAAEGETDERGEGIKTNRFFNPQIHEMMETIGNGEGGLTAAEITDLSHIMDFMANFAKTYKRVFQNGRYVDADTIAEADISLARKAKHGYARNAVVRFVQKTAEDYGMFVFDPATVARMADGYRNGFFTHLHEEMREAALQMAAVRYELQTAQSEFYKEHKGYAPEKRMVTVRGVEMPADFAISLYMTAKRKQSWLGLVQSGYRLFLEDGDVSAKALGAKDEVYTDEQLADIVKGFRSEIDRVLTDTDRAYIATVEGVLKRAGELKMERDIQRMGFTNATEDYYYPILRAHMAKEFDADLASGKAGYFDTVTNLSMNKDTVKNNAELGIQSVNQVISRHIDQTAMYYGLSNMVDNFNMLSNLNLSDNPGKPETMLRTANESIFGKKAMQYFQKMLKDLEGVYYADPSEKSWNRRIDKLRSNAAVAAIAANPKVIATQFSSLFAGTAILSPRDIAKGITITKVGKYSDVDKYSEVARLRNANLEAARAETITDKVGKVGEFAMRPVAATDRLVVQIEFGACQAYVERTQGLAIGTEENLVAAGKLLNRVINETQQGANLTERSAMARSSNPIYKGLAMFRNDAVKQIGRVIDGFGELGAIKEDLRTETDSAKIEELKGRQKTVRRKTAKAVGALVGASMYQALIGLLFAAFLNRLKDKDDDEIARDVVVDSVAGMFTGLPIISQSIEFFTDGYGVEDFTISSFNDLLQSTQDMGKVIGGKATEGEVKSAIRGAIYSGGKLLGIPTRNAYNYFYGTVNTINEYAGYQVHGLLYSDNYKSELYKALNDGNTDRAQMLGSLLVDSSFGGYSKATKDAIKPLVAAGYTVLPRTVGDSITYDGQEYKLTSRQKARFQKVYGQASAAVQKVVALQSYRKLSDEVKAKTIKRIYDMYYNLAIDDLLGTDTEDKTVLFSYAIDPDKLALIVAQAQSLQADTDKNGNAIAGSKKQKVVAYIGGLKLTAAQKFMIMGYLGYRNAKGEEQVKAYINRLGALSKAEKKTLFEYSGYAA